jgi:tetratricopeptide (TPR) repeat protein
MAECRAYVDLAEQMIRARPGDLAARRGALVATTRMAEFCEMRGDRDSALVFYRRAERFARDAVDALPNNTDAARDLSIVYGTYGLVLAIGGELDSALAVSDRGMRIFEDLAAKDPDNALQQADVAASHYEIGTMLMKGRRHEAAARSFGEAWERFGRLSTSDTSNAETRINMARSGREAGNACDARAHEARSVDERSRWRNEAHSWWARSLALYRALEQSGALTGEDAAAPEELDERIAGRSP